MSKTIQSIHFVPGRVIVDYGDRQVFQFCKVCRDGKHVKSFLNHFCPEVNLQLMDKEMAIYFERKFYRVLVHGDIRRAVNREAYAFGEYVQKRHAFFLRQRERAARRAARLQEAV